MNMLWPASLYLLILIPLILAGYIWQWKRRKRFTIRYSSLSLVREAAPSQSWVRKHLPFTLFLLTLTALAFALARPQAVVTVPSNNATIVLAIDVSRSMCSTDIAPNRLEAAKDAAQAFVQNHQEGRKIGVVVFAGFAELIMPPSTDQAALVDAIENITTARRTAIGSAILRSLDTIAEMDDRVAPSDMDEFSGATPPAETQREYAPHIIVLLTDGRSNAGPFPLSAAEQAVARGIRVYTIGFGTINNSSPMNCGDQFEFQGQFGGPGFDQSFGGGGGGGGNFRREIDEETLKQIAEMTGGDYYAAASASELQDVFDKIPAYLSSTRELTEVSAFFAVIAACLAVIAIALAFLWHPLG
jgi:Ca-activated chloride channel family protein